MSWSIIEKTTIPCNTVNVQGYKRSLRVTLCKDEGKEICYFVQIFAIKYCKLDIEIGGCYSERISYDEGKIIFDYLLKNPDKSYDLAQDLAFNYNCMFEPYC